MQWKHREHRGLVRELDFPCDQVSPASTLWAFQTPFPQRWFHQSQDSCTAG